MSFDEIEFGNKPKEEDKVGVTKLGEETEEIRQTGCLN